jgi:DNA uptake protein ComE-like DNA-binding protein
MSDLSTVLRKIPNWVWYSFIPIFGGLALVYAGNKTKTKAWIILGLGFTGISLILSYTEIAGLIWLFQIGTSFYLKKKYLLKTSIKRVAITDRETAKLVAEYRGKIDINTASKDDLVYSLGLPIVYANEIEAIRKDGFTFTRIEELTEIAGIPENYVYKIEPLVMFSYDINKDFAVSWRRLNLYSIPQLIECGILPNIAEKIVAEREKNGLYNSVIDVKNRTGIPINHYHHLI